MTKEKISTMYYGVEIEYDENRNRWKFELHGRERSAESLTNAKKTIDKPKPKDKTEFKPVEVFVRARYLSDFTFATVTSVTEDGCHYWVRLEDGTREKKNENEIFSKRSENVQYIAQLEDLAKQEDSISEQRQQIAEKMFLAVVHT